MALLKYLFVFGILAVSLRNVRAVSEDDRTKIKEAILPFLSSCSQEFGVSEGDVEAAKADTTHKLDPCFMGCLFKKTKVINEEGLFDAENTGEMIKKYLSDESEQNKALEIISSCKTVNERDVSDGEKGCDRAKFLFDCFIPHKETFIN